MNRKYKQKIFWSGKIVEYEGTWREVDHIVLRNMQLYVSLKDVKTLIHEDEIKCDLTEYDLARG